MTAVLLEKALLRMSGALMEQVAREPRLAHPLVFIGSALGLLGQGIDQVVARPMAEVALIKRFLVEVKALVPAALAGRIAEALLREPADLRLCSVEAHLEEARALLIEVQALLEAEGEGDAALRGFWRELRAVRGAGGAELMYLW